MGAQRRRVTWEVKVEAVRLTRENGRSVADVAREVGIRPDRLHEGRRAVAAQEARAMPAPGGTPPPPAENPEAEGRRRELEGARQEREFLRQAAAFFAKDSR
jgi:transposase